jgi:hypothetical protein
MGGRGLYGSNYTAGWALMTPEERAEHRKQMRAAKLMTIAAKSWTITTN